MLEKKSRPIAGIAILLLNCLLIASLAKGEHLPTRIFTTADGLPRDVVSQIRQDSRGFLWFCTLDGLSRFDGYGFVTYTTEDGLPHRHVYDILETHDGVYWVATEDGLARFNPKGQRGTSDSAHAQSPGVGRTPMFVTYRPEGERGAACFVLYEDSQRILWCGASGGLYRIEQDDADYLFRRVDLTPSRSQFPIIAMVRDRRGALWVGADGENGLFRILPDNRVEHYTVEQGLPGPSVSSLCEDRDGKLWAGMRGFPSGLCRLVDNPAPNRPVVARTYSQKDGLPSTWTNAIRQTSDGTLWVATDGGLAKLDAGAAERTALFQAYKKSQGLCTKVFSFLEERDGNLWVGTDCGLIKVARGGVVRYTQDDGLAGSNSVAIFTTRAGELMVVSSNEKGEHWLNRFAEGKFTAVRPNLTKGYQGWGWGQLYVNDRAGQWWMPSNRSLFRFPKVNDISQLARVSPKAIYAGREFGTDSEVFRVYEDSRGDIWIMTTGERTLFKWDRRTEELRDYTNEVDHRWAVSFTEDRAGNLWLGTTQRTEGRLMRYKDDRFTMFTQSDGAPRGWIGALYVDHAGRLWIASTLDGVARVDDPSAEHPVFVRYDRSSGLSTNGASCLNEDQFGRIYIGTGRGLDRLDPATGRIKHFTSADGLPQGGIVVACRDSQGAIWFGGEQGLARVIPEPDRAHQPPNVLLTGVRAGGIAETVSEFGEPTVAPLELSSSQTQVSVDFIGLGASLGEDLKYQYQFEGASDWSAPIVQRTVDFANLAPGSYHFFVRAINSDGLFSETPASFAFTIASPIWKRWWFIALATMLTCGIAYAAYRYRVAQLIKLERVRMRIATDLHDDIGSSLSQIAILSEVARHDLRDGSAAGEPLSVIAQTSRELVDSMSDIVWAINPKRDSLRDLVQRMRGFATDVLTAKDIDFEFNAPENSESLKLDTDVRREVFLIFKESVNNIVRHSQSEKADIRFGLRQGSLVLQVIDWGKGFDTDLESGGHGLFSMRQRARNIDGDLSITSVRGRGSTVTLRVPLSVQHRGSSLKKHLPE